jgi:predicted small integral membrane protein
MQHVSYFVVRIVLVFCFYVVASPLAILAILLRRFVVGHEQYKGLQVVVLMVGLLYLLGVPWFASRTAQHVAFENRGVGEATSLAFQDLRFYLAFLPVVGHWFAPAKKSDDNNDSA